MASPLIDPKARPSGPSFTLEDPAVPLDSAVDSATGVAPQVAAADTAIADSVSFVSFVAQTEQEFDTALRFYIDVLGFHVAREMSMESLAKSSAYTSKGLPLFDATTGVAVDSFREMWLEAFPLSELDSAGCRKPAQEARGKASEGATVKLRLASRPAHSEAETEAETTKQESGNPEISASSLPATSVVFFCADLTGLQTRLKTANALFVQAGDTIFVSDPLGNYLGFTSFPQPDEPPVTDPSYFLREIPIPQTRPSIAPTDFDGSSRRKRIAVLTSGGDAPGMNAAVRAVVRAGLSRGCDVYAVMEGFQGLVDGPEQMRKMQWQDVRGWLSLGGTLIGTARCAAFRTREGRLKAAGHMIQKGIDALVVCGGDGSLTGADTFRAEWPELLSELNKNGSISAAQVAAHSALAIVGLVGSIDNDMTGTDATIGAHSSLERICEMVDYIDSTAQSHARAFVVEVMGRHCGWLGLMAGLATGADYVFIPERPPKAGEWATELKAVCRRHREKGKRKTVVIVAEGAIDSDLQPITSNAVKTELQALGLDTRVTTLGHVQRGGPACAYDRLLATLQGVEAVEAVLESQPGIPSPMIAVEENKITRKPLAEAVAQTRKVAKAIAARDFETAVALRGTEFNEAWANFQSVALHDDGSQLLAEDGRLKLAIVHVGAPAGGFNAATRGAALYALSRGHRVFAIQNGFTGLIRHGAVRELQWIDVDPWAARGGSEIGTNRHLPSEDLGTVSYYFQKYQFDGLIIIGGFEAFLALHELAKARQAYPVLRLPMVCLPATISNNVPGTEYSVGSDTCLNALVGYCDVVKQSASATRRRVFVVEVQGGHSGFVAAYAGLVTGALAVYTPEHVTDLQTLQEDVALLRDNYAADQGENRAGKLLIRNEQASEVFTTELIADIIGEAAGRKFETRTATPGHVQQGNIPSAMDRVRAVRLAVRCCEFIENTARELSDLLEAQHLDGDAGLKLRYRHGHPVTAGMLLRGDGASGASELLVPPISGPPSGFSSVGMTPSVSGAAWGSNLSLRSLIGQEEVYGALDGDTAVVIGIEGLRIKFTDIFQLYEQETDVELRKGTKIHWEKYLEVGDMLSGRLRLRQMRE